MHITDYPSITSSQEHVELKDYRRPTKKEYVRYVRKLAEHFQCDPATLTEDVPTLTLKQARSPLDRAVLASFPIFAVFMRILAAVSPFRTARP